MQIPGRGELLVAKLVIAGAGGTSLIPCKGVIEIRKKIVFFSHWTLIFIFYSHTYSPEAQVKRQKTQSSLEFSLLTLRAMILSR